MTNTPLNVLFLCTHNSARSIIAEAVMNKLGAGRFKAYSAGSQPSGRVHPYALDMLGKLGYDICGMRSKSWEEFTAPEAPQLDFVFTVCDNAANETCPVWPGQPISAHWACLIHRAPKARIPKSASPLPTHTACSISASAYS